MFAWSFCMLYSYFPLPYVVLVVYLPTSRRDEQSSSEHDLRHDRSVTSVLCTKVFSLLLLRVMLCSSCVTTSLSLCLYTSRQPLVAFCREKLRT